MKKILHIAQSAGGVSEYLKTFFKYSDSTKYEIYLICSNDYRKDLDIFKKLLKKIKIIEMDRDINLLKDFKSYRRILEYVKEVKPDIIHAHSSKAGVYGRIISKKLGIPVIYNAHGWAFNMDISNFKKIIYGSIEKVLSFYTDKIINISQDEYDKATQYICKEKMMVINNGIDIEKFERKFDSVSIKYKYNIPDNKFIIGMVARLSDQKDPKLYVEIAKYIYEKYGKNIFFLFVGDGELRKEIDNEMNKFTKNYLITGWINNVNEFISIFDIAILTSKWEGFGLVLAEYMAAKKPIVSSNVGGIKNVIENEKTGYLIDSRNPKDFGDKIIYLLNNREKCFELKRNAFKSVNKKFNAKDMVKKHEILYEEVLLEKEKK
ncbi:glycosyltransferase family 4 protein [Clostridium perfringens]|uniref:glycosyltransferase family 4 protein n=1 Tax=Clostridium perfringens TaxID=1502 RepID=UPI0039EC49E1